MVRLIHRWLAVLFAGFAGLPAVAADPSPPKPADARRTALVQAGYTQLPLAVSRGLLPPGVPVPTALFLGLYVDGTIDREEVKFALSSGLQDTFLELKLTERLKLKLGEEVATAGLGQVLVARRTEVPGLMIGPYDTRKDWRHVPAQAADLSTWPGGAPGGVLGMEVLDPWAAIMDYPARALYLRPPLMTAWPRLAGSWQVTSWQEDGAPRKLDPKATPTFSFADRRLKLTDGGTTREYAIRLMPGNDGVYTVMLCDPKDDGKPEAVGLADGLLKVGDGLMTACLALDVKKAKEPPRQFAAPKGSGYVLLELKLTTPDARKQPADPLRELLLKDGYTAIQMDREPDGMRVVTARVGRDNLRLVVDTGATVSAFDTAGLAKWGAERLGGVEVNGLGGKVKGEKVILRGLTLGAYDTRRTWMGVYGQGFELAGVNKILAERKRPPIQGVLGNLDLLSGSAVIDFGTNTLYLRPVKETFGPELAGKWVGVRYEADGRKGRYAPGSASVEFKGGKVRFTNPGSAPEEAGFHVRAEGDRYSVAFFDPKADELADGFGYSSGALLKLTGGTLTLVFQQGSREPTDFSAPKGSGLVLIEYERAK